MTVVMIAEVDARKLFDEHIGGDFPSGYTWHRVEGLSSMPRRFGGLLFVWSGNCGLAGLYATKTKI